MIRVTIEIEEVRDGGVGVHVVSDVDPRAVPELEGVVFVGICRAINKYMRRRGAPNFDCLREHRIQ
jgi:hypothetical protein